MRIIGYSINENIYICEMSQDEMNTLGLPKNKILGEIRRNAVTSGKEISISNMVFIKDSVKDKLTT